MELAGIAFMAIEQLSRRAGEENWRFEISNKKPPGETNPSTPFDKLRTSRSG